MTHLTLLTANFRRHKLRTTFTVLSVTVSFAIFVVLCALNHGLNGMVSYARAGRLTVIGENGHPAIRDEAKIKAIPGVKAVSYRDGFYGYYRDHAHGVQVEAVSFAEHLRTFPENTLTPTEYRTMMSDRHCAIAGPRLMKKMGWHVGQSVRLIDGAQKMDGTTAWGFQICGVFKSTLPDNLLQSLFVHYAYLNDARDSAVLKDRAWNFYVLVDDPRQTDAIARTIDATFADSMPTTQTLPDSMLIGSVLKSFGDIGAIITAIAAAVFGAMLLVAGNTMAGSVRERMNEFAMLRALGFARERLRTQVLCEAAIIVGTGAGLGLILGSYICTLMAPKIDETLPYFFVTWQSVVLAGALAGAFAVLVGAVPARRVTRLEIAESLRRI